MSRTAKSLSYSDIDGSLASPKARSRSFVNKTITIVDVLYQTFAFLRTCFLYYNLCLCKSFKERALHESALKIGHLQRGGQLSFAGAKVRLFLKLAKLSGIFFWKRCKFSSYTLYIIYMRAKAIGGDSLRRSARHGGGRAGRGGGGQGEVAGIPCGEAQGTTAVSPGYLASFLFLDAC